MKRTLIFIFLALLFVFSISILFQQRGKKLASSITQAQQKTENPQNTQEKQEILGATLAGKKSYFYAFSKDEYEKALKSEKIVFIDFYANWCPICRAESPELVKGFNSLDSENVIGFRVHFNDEETGSEEKALAQELGVTYQHTKVIFKNGKVILKSLEEWNSERFLKEVETILNSTAN